MNHCQNCGQINTQNSNFCRFCGTKFQQFQPQNQGGYEYSPPRPYSWKTDEFQVSDSKQNSSQPVNQVQPLPPPIPQNRFSQMSLPPQPMIVQTHHNLAYNFHCPRCGTNILPRLERKISTAGWIVFAALLLIFFPLFWIGFLIKDNVRVCSVCNLRID